MRVERFIAKRIGGIGNRSFSGMIAKIAIAAVALSMMVMIITTNVITGFKNQISNKVFDFWGHIHVSSGLASDSFEAVPFDYDQHLVDTIASADRITYQRPPTIADPELLMPTRTSQGGVTRVDPFIITSGILSDNDLFEAILLKGSAPDSNQEELTNFLVAGQLIDYPQDKASRDILVSSMIARRMRLNVDDRLIINFIVDGDPIKRAFRVSGIYKTGLGEYDRRFVIVDMRILQDVLGWTTNQISGLEIHLDEWQDMDVFTEYIYFELLPGRLYAESARQKFYQIFEWLELQNINERVLIILMVLVAMINMITALMIFVLERTKMIGILKALGTKNWTIRQIFLYHALRIIAYGMIIGNALALLFCYVQMQTGILKLSEADYYLDRVPIEFNWMSMLLINAGTIVIVLLFLIVPTRIISGISPVKTIQFK